MSSTQQRRRLDADDCAHGRFALTASMGAVEAACGEDAKGTDRRLLVPDLCGWRHPAAQRAAKKYRPRLRVFTVRWVGQPYWRHRPYRAGPSPDICVPASPRRLSATKKLRSAAWRCGHTSTVESWHQL